MNYKVGKIYELIKKIEKVTGTFHLGEGASDSPDGWFNSHEGWMNQEKNL
jgi:hypothetical protein